MGLIVAGPIPRRKQCENDLDSKEGGDGVLSES